MVIKEGVYSYLATLGGNITTSSWNYQVIHSLLLVLNIFLTSQNFSNFFSGDWHYTGENKPIQCC